MTSQELQERFEEIRQMYVEDNLSSTQIAKIFNVKRYQINYLLEKNGIQKSTSEARRKYYLNEHYFDNIDTPNKAYILGFLYADGYNNPINHTIVLGLSARDEDILECIRREIPCDKPLGSYCTERKDGTPPRHMKILTLASKYMSDTIIKWGLCPNKTFILQFPNFLSDELIPHFIRGYFDGDGCAYLWKSKGTREDRITVSIMSSTVFCLQMQKVLKEKANINMHVNNATGHTDNKLIRTSNRQEVQKFVEYIYKDADLYMARKKEKFIEYFNKD